LETDSFATESEAEEGTEEYPLIENNNTAAKSLTIHLVLTNLYIMSAPSLKINQSIGM
jgi:hypothetical protein